MGSEGSWCPKIFVRFLPDEYDCSHMETSSPEDAEDCIAPSDRAFGVTPSLRCLASGQMLFREGAASAGVFRLRSGCVRLIRTTLTGGQATMHTVRQGEFFAEASLFSAIYHCDAVALESSEVLVFQIGIRTTLTGGQATMHTVRQGEFFAEASLFSAIYHCDAVALESSEVLVF